MASLGYIQDWLPEPFKSLPTHMDYRGQQIAERIFQVVITIFAVIGLVWGYIEQKFSYTVYCTLAGFFLSCLVVLPPWPVFRVRKDMKWQKPLEKEPDSDTCPQPSISKTTTTTKTSRVEVKTTKKKN